MRGFLKLTWVELKVFAREPYDPAVIQTGLRVALHDSTLAQTRAI